MIAKFIGQSLGAVGQERFAPRRKNYDQSASGGSFFRAYDQNLSRAEQLGFEGLAASQLATGLTGGNAVAARWATQAERNIKPSMISNMITPVDQAPSGEIDNPIVDAQNPLGQKKKMVKPVSSYFAGGTRAY